MSPVRCVALGAHAPAIAGTRAEGAAVAVRARAGDTLAEGHVYRWVAYELSAGDMVAALYVEGRLLRRDTRGWWVANFHGRRIPVKGDPVAYLHGTHPPGWDLHPEHAELDGGAK